MKILLKILEKILDKFTPRVYSFRMIKIWNCLRCNHQWASKMQKPRICPRCKSPYWAIPKGTLKMGRPKGGSKK